MSARNPLYSIDGLRPKVARETSAASQLTGFNRASEGKSIEHSIVKIFLTKDKIQFYGPVSLL